MKYRLEKPSQFEAMEDEASFVDLDHFLAVARRQWRVVALSVVVAAVFGMAYALTAVPIYTASASVLIDTGNQKIADQLSAVTGVLADEASILSQVELLKSDKLAIAVGEKLDLKHDPLFTANRSGPLQNIFSAVKAFVDVPGWFKSDGKSADKAGKTPTTRDIKQALQGGLRVTRVTGTYVLALTYSSVDPNLSSKIVQGYAEAYLTDQLDSKYEATRRASDWLQMRISELRQRALQTDLAVQKFRAEKGLISSDGQLVSEQQLTQINAQLVKAQADRAEAEAKYNRIKNIVASGDMSGAVTESLSSQVINDLRSKYLEASRKQTDIATRLGENHIQAVRLKTEMNEYRRLMFEELGRIAQSYKNNFEIAQVREQGLESQLAQATGVSATANDSQVQLRELEREADTYKKLYETFLQRYQEAVQQQSFPVTEARIISTPEVPAFPSAPKKPLILAISMFLGLLVGGGLGALREFRDRFFRTGDQIREVLDLEPLGTVPYTRPTDLIKRSKNAASSTHSRVIDKSNSVANYVIDHPLSSFAETLRSAKIAVDVVAGDHVPKMVGVVSVLPGEGKSTISINLAELLASQGSRVLLIDADLRNPGATRQIGRHAERGIIEALNDTATTRDILMCNPETKLAFLPAVIKRRVPYSAELLSSEEMDRLIKEVSGVFDYIIFDLPPLAPVVDARAMSSRLDTYLFVVEWGKTARNVVKKTLRNNSVVAEKCAGVILNKVDTSKMRLYQAYGSSEFYSSKFSSYYGE